MTHFTPYQPRPIESLGIETINDFRLKGYSIRFGDAPLDRDRFGGAWNLIREALPTPAVSTERPGVGFVILHQGRTGDYAILCWWDRENELPTRVFLRDDSGWRPAVGGESFCVWDLQVIAVERDLYVRTVLNGTTNGVDQYMTT